MTHKLLKIAGIFSVCFTAMTAHGQQASIDVRGEPLTSAEITVMPPVCKLIVVERPMIHLGAGDGPLAEYAYLFEEPRYQLAKGNPHIHHYCWALVSKQRYFSASGKTKREYWYAQYKGDIEYVLRRTNKNWPHFDVLYLELASMHMIRGEYLSGIQKADGALKYNPWNEKAYIFKSDAYKHMGKKDLAIKFAQEGFSKNPESSPLRRRLKSLGITPPESPIKSENIVESNPEIENQTPIQPIRNQNAPTPKEPDSDMGRESSNSSSPESGQAPDETGDAPNNRTQKMNNDSPPNNPYCRFCP